MVQPVRAALRRLFFTRYLPLPEQQAVASRIQTQSGGGVEASVAVLDAAESERVFGVPLARRGVQPVYLQIINHSPVALRLQFVGVDPNYYTPLEAAALNHFSIFRRLSAFGVVGWLFLPVLALIPFKLVTAYRANRKMDDCFRALAFHLRPIPAGGTSAGYVFTNLDSGTKIVHVCLYASGDLREAVRSFESDVSNAGPAPAEITPGGVSTADPSAASASTAGAISSRTPIAGPASLATADDATAASPAPAPIGATGSTPAVELTFSINVPGISADYLHRDFSALTPPADRQDCDLLTLVNRLSAMPAATTNAHGTRHGDPVNLVVIGPFPTILAAFAARWDESETITLSTCWKTMRAFLLGSQYRYSPVSPLFLFGRSQDVALQRTRRSINERLHLRLWITGLRFQGQPVWVGQISRDIGVRFTTKVWNLTTHRVDPDVDEARDYVVEDLLQAERLDAAGYVDGVGACPANAPRRNLTGDPYFTDGKRAVLLVSPTRTRPRFIAWC